MDGRFKYEQSKLSREKQITETVISVYKNELITKLPPKEDIVQRPTPKKEKKSLLQRLISRFF